MCGASGRGHIALSILLLACELIRLQLGQARPYCSMAVGRGLLLRAVARFWLRRCAYRDRSAATSRSRCSASMSASRSGSRCDRSRLDRPFADHQSVAVRLVAAPSRPLSWPHGAWRPATGRRTVSPTPSWALDRCGPCAYMRWYKVGRGTRCADGVRGGFAAPDKRVADQQLDVDSFSCFNRRRLGRARP